LLITQQLLKLEKKINTDLETLGFQNYFVTCLTKFENCHFLLNKISHRFLVTISYLGGGGASLTTFNHNFLGGFVKKIVTVEFSQIPLCPGKTVKRRSLKEMHFFNRQL
jgi:hypothetical protein